MTKTIDFLADLAGDMRQDTVSIVECLIELGARDEAVDAIQNRLVSDYKPDNGSWHSLNYHSATWQLVDTLRELVGAEGVVDTLRTMAGQHAGQRVAIARYLASVGERAAAVEILHATITLAVDRAAARDALRELA